ncbi:MAG: hypothetical protein Q7W13_07865 [Bacteroidia bacterium]|nr:hypothetical protein [Bacteroidia bacterium]
MKIKNIRHWLKDLDQKPRFHLFWVVPLFVLIILFLLPFIIFFRPISFLYKKNRTRQIKKFYENNQGKYFFFYSNKNGWGDFITNNVLPILPKGTLIYNIYQNKKHQLSRIYDVISFYKISRNEAKLPFIIKFCSQAPKIMTFKNNFNIARKTPKRDDLIQRDIQNKLETLVS